MNLKTFCWAENPANIAYDYILHDIQEQTNLIYDEKYQKVAYG